MKWFNILLLSVLLFSCKKEQIDLEITPISSGEDIDLHDIHFVSDQVAYICGGELWESGVILKSTDGGQTWVKQLETDNILFQVEFKNESEGVAVGYSGRVWKTVNGGNTWIRIESTESYPVYTDAAFVGNSEIILAAGNNYFSGGFSAFSFNFESFIDSLINVDMRGVHFFDQQKGLMCGYGCIYTTVDGANSWQATEAKGDYFKAMAFNDNLEGITIGYQGKILSSTDSGFTWNKTARKASFFTTKGNLEGVDVLEKEAFIVGQNSAFFYNNNFLKDEWLQVNTPFNQDLFDIELINSTTGFVVGEKGLIFKFNY